jgi:hypothetical protein
VTGGGSIEGDPIFSLTGDLLSAPAIILSLNGVDKATFGFVVTNGAEPKGNLNYHDHETGDRIKATSITALFISSGTCGPNTHARFTGKATVNGVANQDFEVNVDDCGEPGSAPGLGPDTFGIAVTGPIEFYFNGPKPLIGGNIQIH